MHVFPKIRGNFYYSIWFALTLLSLLKCLYEYADDKCVFEYVDGHAYLICNNTLPIFHDFFTLSFYVFIQIVIFQKSDLRVVTFFPLP